MKESILFKKYDEAFHKANDLLDLNSTVKLSKLSKYLSLIPESEFQIRGYKKIKLAVLGGYTTTTIAPLIKALLFKHKFYVDIYESEYQTFEISIVSKNQDLIDFKPDIIYFCVGSDHLGFEHFESECIRWKNLLEQTRSLFSCDIIINNFELPQYRPFGHFETKEKTSKTNYINNLNMFLLNENIHFVHIHDVEYLSSYFGKKHWRDDRLYDLSKMPVSYEFIIPYAESLSSIVCALFGKTKKCLVLDLDNTLWGGVIGDDGLKGIKIGEDSGIGESFKRFQSYIKSLKNRGIILAVCSKNDIHNAKEPFEKNTNMVLRLEDISCFVANWDPKHINIEHIAKTLNIGLDSMVFVDDNPAERYIVKQNLPEVEVLDLNEDPSTYVSILAQKRFFEITSLTKEDMKKSNLYLENAKREASVKSFDDYDSFLKSLEMKGICEPFDQNNIERIGQLINKTNQFNLTTRRYTLSELDSIYHSPNYITSYLKLKDRFGDHGLISVLIAKKINEYTYEIDTWLMSCRVLKRGAEYFLFSFFIDEMIKRNITTVFGRYLKTEKNNMVSNLLEDVGFDLLNQENGQKTYQLNLKEKTLQITHQITKVSEKDY